jgi:hypothetical protein
MSAVKEPVTVQLSGAVEGRYVIRDRRADGELVIVPDTSIEAIRDELGVRPLTTEEWDEVLEEHGPDMLPPDSES